MRRSVYGIDSLERLTQGSSLLKTLEDLEIPENAIVYVEEHREGQKQFSWQEEFELDLHRLSIKFNSPYVDQQGQDQEESVLNQEFPFNIGTFFYLD